MPDLLLKPGQKPNIEALKDPETSARIKQVLSIQKRIQEQVSRVLEQRHSLHNTLHVSSEIKEEDQRVTITFPDQKEEEVVKEYRTLHFAQRVLEHLEGKVRDISNQKELHERKADSLFTKLYEVITHTLSIAKDLPTDNTLLSSLRESSLRSKEDIITFLRNFFQEELHEDHKEAFNRELASLEEEKNFQKSVQRLSKLKTSEQETCIERLEEDLKNISSAHDLESLQSIAEEMNHKHEFFVPSPSTEEIEHLLELMNIQKVFSFTFEEEKEEEPIQEAKPSKRTKKEREESLEKFNRLINNIMKATVAIGAIAALAMITNMGIQAQKRKEDKKAMTKKQEGTDKKTDEIPKELLDIAANTISFENLKKEAKELGYVFDWKAYKEANGRFVLFNQGKRGEKQYTIPHRETLIDSDLSIVNYSNQQEEIFEVTPVKGKTIVFRSSLMPQEKKSMEVYSLHEEAAGGIIKIMTITAENSNLQSMLLKLKYETIEEEYSYESSRRGDTFSGLGIQPSEIIESVLPWLLKENSEDNR